MLFLIYINDLPLNISSTVRLFADDCVIYRKITSTDDIVTLQDEISKISEWCNTWRMSLNPKKCQCMCFSRSLSITYPVFLLNSVPIDSTNQYKYLGLHLTPNLSWHTHIKTIISSANRSLGYIRRNFRSSPENLKRILYTTIVRPKLEYASSIRHPHQKNLTDSIESVQNRAARFIFNDYSRTSSVSSMKSRLNLSPLSSRRRISRLSLLHKVFYTPFLKMSLLNPPTYISSRLDHSCKIARPKSSSQAHQHSLIPEAVVDWNDLPDAIVTIPDSKQFRLALQNHLY